jgi:hypothetical protein
MTGTPDPLQLLAAQLREEDTPISPHVVDPGETIDELPADYGYVVEAVREGYLLHYAKPRLLAGHDEDLALLAGDYLYALGIERLVAIGDTRAVGVLADLISASAQLHSEARGNEVAPVWERAVSRIAAS